MRNTFELIDKPTFFGAIALLLTIVFPLILFPAQGADWIAIAKTFMTDQLGFLYLALGLAACAFMGLCCVIQFRDRAARFVCVLVNTIGFRHT